ncbi:hypothetical protein HK102_005713, partial [Quaeritorhiza haematococci]
MESSNSTPSSSVGPSSSDNLTTSPNPAPPLTTSTTAVTEPSTPESTTTFTHPDRVATLALSLLRDEAWESLAQLSSTFTADKFSVLWHPSHPDPISIFRWKSQSRANSPTPPTLDAANSAVGGGDVSSMTVRELIELWTLNGSSIGPGLDIISHIESIHVQESVPPHDDRHNQSPPRGSPPSIPSTPPSTPSPSSFVFYRVLDQDTAQACVPFAHRASDGAIGVVVLFLAGVGPRWVYHDLVVTRDWGKFRFRISQNSEERSGGGGDVMDMEGVEGGTGGVGGVRTLRRRKRPAWFGSLDEAWSVWRSRARRFGEGGDEELAMDNDADYYTDDDDNDDGSNSGEEDEEYWASYDMYAAAQGASK